MRRVIRKRIRRQEDGLDVAVDFNADIAVNVGGSHQAAHADTKATDEDSRPPDDPAATEGNETERDDS